MTVEIRKLTQSDYAAWDQYNASKGASIYHDSRWPRLIKRVFGHESHHLVALENSIVVGVLPLVQLKSFLFGNFLVSMPFFNYGGVVADSQEISELLLNAAHDLLVNLGCTHIEMRFKDKLKYNLPVRTDKVSIVLNLPDDPEILWQAIGSKRRAQVKRPLREGVEFNCGGMEFLDDFYHVFSTNMRDLGTPVYGKVFFKEILKEFGDETLIAVVRLNGEPVAAGFLIHDNGRVEIPWASTLRKVNKIGVNMYLYWHILKTCIEKGFKVFDFGRSSKDAGALKFKKQWGGDVEQLYWYYDLPQDCAIPMMNPTNSKYKFLISVWSKLPLAVANLIGPPIVKNLP